MDVKAEWVELDNAMAALAAAQRQVVPKLCRYVANKKEPPPTDEDS
jgi:hypothetical protein